MDWIWRSHGICDDVSRVDIYILSAFLPYGTMWLSSRVNEHSEVSRVPLSHIAKLSKIVIVIISCFNAVVEPSAFIFHSDTKVSEISKSGDLYFMWQAVIRGMEGLMPCQPTDILRSNRAKDA